MGKFRITMEIPEEYRGYKNYSILHVHCGEVVTLVDLDDDPNTITFDVDKFSTFALAATDEEVIGEVEDDTETDTTFTGDANGDGEVTIVDVIIVIKGLLNGSEWEVLPDMNGDGKLTLVDIIRILKLAVK